MSMPMTVITVQQIRTQPFRKRINIPVSDHTTQAWWDQQVDPSTSVRLLILEEARVHGLVDRMNRIGMQPGAVPPAMPTGPTAVPNPSAGVPTPFQSAAPAGAASGPQTLLTDPRDIELALANEELRVLREQVGAAPLFRIA